MVTRLTNLRPFDCAGVVLESNHGDTFPGINSDVKHRKHSRAWVENRHESHAADASLCVLVVGEDGAEGFLVLVHDRLEAADLEVLEDGLDLGETIERGGRSRHCCGC